MKKRILLLMLMISSLTLAESLPAKKEKTEKDHVVLSGQMVFNKKNLIPIRFRMENKLGGFFVLILFQENAEENIKFLIEKGTIVNEIFKEEIYSNLNFSVIKKDQINYFLINFSNKEIRNKNLFFIIIRTVNKIQKKMDCILLPE